ncbi:MAG: FAD-dependent oxidoreductase [Kiloniellaceae bacterium]
MRILIVGAGVMGLAVAEALLEAGHEIAIYEQGAIPNDLASSSDQHRLIRYPYGDKTGYARLVDPAYAAWRRLWGRLGRNHYVETGTLVVSRETGGWMDGSAASLTEIDSPVEWLDAATLATRFPLLKIDPADRGFHLQSGGLLLARPILESLSARIFERGGTLFAGRRVTGIDTAAAQLTLADGSRDSGDLIVVTLGAWLCDLLPELAVRVTPSRQAYAYLAPPARTRAAWAAHPMLLDIGTESGFYLVPPAAGTAMKIGDHGFSLTGHPDRQRDGRPEDVAESLAMASERIADFEEIQVEWINTCFYMVEANERFVAEQRGAAWILTGFSGHGFKFAPLIGEQLAEVIAGGLTPADFAAWISGGWISGRHGAMQDAASPK